MNNPIELSPERALELMREVVAEYGEDHVYDFPAPSGCLYVHEGAPSCLVGHVLHRAGVPLDAMGTHENMAPTHSYFLRATGITEQVALPLAVAQDVQDEGMTWGEALAAAEERYARQSEAG